MTVSREIKEGPQPQGADEQVPYRLDTANWNSDPSSPATPSAATAYIYTVTDVAGVETFTDVTSTKMSGSCSISGQYITMPTILSLVAGTKYRWECKFTLSGNIFEAFGIINAER